MKKILLGRGPSYAVGVFFGFYAALSVMTAAVFLNQVGPHPFIFVYLTYAVLNATMSYGMFRDRRWVLPVLTLNLVFAAERAVSGGLTSFTAAAIAVSVGALAVSLSRREHQKGETLAVGPIALFTLQQLLPHLVEAPVLQ